MTHRLALILSIALTLAVGAGVFVGRDRLFAPESATSAATVISNAAQVPGGNQVGQLPATSPRIVTVTLPPDPGSISTQARGERNEHAFSLERDDHSHDDDEGYEHDGEHDDD